MFARASQCSTQALIEDSSANKPTAKRIRKEMRNAGGSAKQGTAGRNKCEAAFPEAGEV